MKYQLILLLLITCNSLFSQNARRYYPSLGGTFMEESLEHLPNEFGFFKVWYKKVTRNISYSDLQRNQDPKGSATFNQLKLIPRRNANFSFFDSGFHIYFRREDPKSIMKTSVLNNNYWRVNSHIGNFHYGIFSPESNEQLFACMKLVNGFTDEEINSQFINRFGNDKIANKDLSPLQVFIQTINEKQQSSIDLRTEFKDLCDSIRATFPKYDCNSIGYQTFIDGEDQVKVRRKIDRFYRGFASQDIQQTLDYHILPDGNMEFIDDHIEVSFPIAYFSPSAESQDSLVHFKLKKLDYNINYDFEKQSYYMILTLKAFKNGLNQDFSSEIVKRDIIKAKDIVTKSVFNPEDFLGLEVYLYPDHFTVDLMTRPDELIEGEPVGLHRLAHTFKLDR